MSKPKGVKPGADTPESGQYRSSRGGDEITAVEGKPMPPTPAPNSSWVLVDKTKHKK